MRTFSAVRTRLRSASHAAPSDAGDDVTNGDTGGNGAHRPTAVDTVAPMDPLLADHPAGNGDAPSPPFADLEPDDVATADTIVEVPAERPVEDEPIEDDPAFDDAPFDEGPLAAVPLAVPLVDAAPETAAAPRRAPAAPGHRSRPALPLLRRRPRVRKVTRIVRRVDAWGVFKISVIFYVILYVILLVAGVLLWNLANTTGTVANVEGFIRDLFGLKTFEFDGEKLFRASWVLGAILVVAGTGLNVTLAILFNLISDLVGGVRVTVLEEEVILRERPVLPSPVAEPVDTDEFADPLAPPTPPVDAYEPPPRPEPEPEPAVAPRDPLLAESTRWRRPGAPATPPSNGRGGSTAEYETEPVPSVDPEDG